VQRHPTTISSSASMCRRVDGCRRIQRPGSYADALGLEDGFQGREEEEDIPAAGGMPHQAHPPYLSCRGAQAAADLHAEVIQQGLADLVRKYTTI